MSIKNQIIKGTIILTFATLLSRVLGFLYRIFLSNLIGAKGMGIFQLIFPVLGFCVALSCGGIQIAVSRFVAESKSNASKYMILISSIIMTLTLSVFTAFILYFFAYPISKSIIQNLSCIKLLKYASYTIPFTALHSCISGYYLGMKKTFVPAVSSVIEQVTKVLSLYIIGIVCINNNIEITPIIAVYSMIISEILGVAFCLITLCGEKKYKINIVELINSFKKLFSVSYVLTLNKIMITFLQCFEAILVPIVLVRSGLSSDNALSLYGILTGMSLPVISFPSALNTSVSTMIMPTIADANTDGNNRAVLKTTYTSIWFSTVMGIFFVGFFLCYGDFVGNVIFGHKEAGEYIKILSGLCPFMYLSITLGSVLHGIGKTNAAFIHNVIGTAIRLACLWFLVPVIGITGYLWGLLLSNLVTTLLHWFYIKKEMKLSFHPIENILLPISWLICSVAASQLIKYIFSFSSFNGKLFNIFTSSISAATLILVFLYFLYKNMVSIKSNL
jgi:stage V sporulation protein B